MGTPLFETLETRRLLAVGTPTELIVVDQFGWRASAARKVALFVDPQTGQNAAQAYTPGPTFQLRRTSDDAVVFTGSIARWKAGATDAPSGDKVWTGDFSSFTAPGEYYVHDPAPATPAQSPPPPLSSHPFKLDDNLFNDVLKTSGRTYYYQRMNTAIPAQFGGNWTHAVDHIGPNQDTQARQWQNGAPVANSARRDVSGGWMDAGDYNKYVPYTTGVIWNLLNAIEWAPAAFGDNWNIPESGNGVPDMLDEVKYEIDWLRKMQLPDGSVINRVASATYNIGNHDPATDTQARYYTAPTTWATASFAASLAHAARVFAMHEAKFPGYANTLKTAALNAWAWLQSTPAMTPANGTDGGNGLAATDAGSTADADFRLRVLAAAELWRATGDAGAKAYFEDKYDDPAGNDRGMHPILNNQFDPAVAPDLYRALVSYASAPSGASATIVTQVKNALRNLVDPVILDRYDRIATGVGESDPYRGFMYTGHYSWGSNQVKADWANMLGYAIRLGVNPANNARYREAAEEYLHYFHGRNPLGYVYLSNMGSKGANLGGDKSVMQVYHSWFGDYSGAASGNKYDGAGSTYGPPPGFLVGGANQYFSVSTISPPYGQPPLKSFKDWNTGWPENSWEITENAIYYQASYTALLAQFSTDTIAPRAHAGTFVPSSGPTSKDAFTVSFSEPVTASLMLHRLNTGEMFELAPVFDAASNTATFTYAPGLLPDGHYRAIVTATDAAGNAMSPAFQQEFVATSGSPGSDTYRLRRDGALVEISKLAGGGSPLTFTAPFAALSRLLIRGGDGADTLELLGSDAADSTSTHAATGTHNGVSYALAGVEAVRYDGLGGWDTLSAGGTLPITLAPGQRMQTITTFGETNLLTVPGAGDVLVTRALFHKGRLDLFDNDLVVRPTTTTATSPLGTWLGSNYGGLSGQVATGREGVRGILSSAANIDTTALGVALAGHVLDFSIDDTALWNGVTVDATSVLIKYTHAGDANLDGLVDGGDYAWIDVHVGATGSTLAYLHGDFNYDGYIDGGDYAHIDITVGSPPL